MSDGMRCVRHARVRDCMAESGLLKTMWPVCPMQSSRRSMPLHSRMKASGMDYTIIRPAGYFSVMEEFLNMARKGWSFLIGSGRNRMNPIHGADLAEVCVDAIENDSREIDVGGHGLLTYREIAELALEVAGKPPKVTCIPLWMMKGVIATTRIFRATGGVDVLLRSDGDQRHHRTVLRHAYNQGALREMRLTTVVARSHPPRTAAESDVAWHLLCPYVAPAKLS